MDASAYLKSHGWLGAGNSLTSGKGLARPLLVSKKQNVLGVGKKRHINFADQWWSRAFDSALEGLSVSKTEVVDGGNEGGEVTVTQTKSGGVLEGLATETGAGLYSFFVKGQGLRGTIQESETKEEAKEQRIEKRKRDVENPGDLLKEERKKRKKANGSEGSQSVSAATEKSCSEDKDLKEERRRKKQEKKGLKLQKAEDTSTLLTPSETETAAENNYPMPGAERRKTEKKKGHKSWKDSASVGAILIPTEGVDIESDEKELKKERRRQKQKAEKLKALSVIPPPETDQSVENGGSKNKEGRKRLKRAAKALAKMESTTYREC